MTFFMARNIAILIAQAVHLLRSSENVFGSRIRFHVLHSVLQLASSSSCVQLRLLDGRSLKHLSTRQWIQVKSCSRTGIWKKASDAAGCLPTSMQKLPLLAKST